MRPILLDIDPANVDTNGYVAAGTGVGPATLAATSSGDNLAHQLNITSAANLSAINFTIVGTDADGKAQTEIVAGPNATTVETTKFFKTVSAVSWSATLGANTVDVGWVDEVVSQTLPLDFYREVAPTISVDETGTATWMVDVTNHNPQEWTDQGQAPGVGTTQWIADDNFGGSGAISADLIEALATWPIRACRVRIESYTNGAELQVRLVQSF